MSLLEMLGTNAEQEQQPEQQPEDLLAGYSPNWRQQPKRPVSGQLEAGNIDLTNRPRVKNPDGSVSTVRAMSFGEDGREILIPTVSDDGRVLADDDAIALYRKTGKHLGIFRDPASATTYAQSLHEDQARALDVHPASAQSGPEDPLATYSPDWRKKAETKKQLEPPGPFAKEVEALFPQTTRPAMVPDASRVGAPPGSAGTKIGGVTGALLKYGLDPMLENPLTTATTMPLMGAAGALPGALGFAARAGMTGAMLAHPAEWAAQKAAEVTLPDQLRAIAEADPTRIPGEQAAVEGGMAGLGVMGELAGRLGRRVRVGGPAAEGANLGDHPDRLLANPENRRVDPKATIRMTERPPEPTGPDYTVEPLTPEAPAKPAPPPSSPMATIKAAVQAADEVAKSIEPKVEPKPVEANADATAPAWLKHNMAGYEADAQRLGVADDIESLSAERLTAKEIRDRLAQRLTGLDPTDQLNVIRAVRAKRGIPSMDESGAFEEWLAQRETPSAVAPAQDVQPTSEPATPSAAAPPPPASLLDKLKTTAKPKHDFSSTQVNLPAKTASAIQDLGARIADEDLAPNGREKESHITVKYGIHGHDVDAVRAALQGEGPIRARFGKTSLFPDSGDGVVVKVDVDSPDLHRLNKKIADAVPHTDTHPEYKPHATVAYVKPGLGKKYEGNASLDGHEVTLDRIAFSDRHGKQVDIPLTGNAGAPAVREEKVGNIDIEPSRFQFKLNTNERGVTRELEGSKKWNPDLAGVIQVWKDPADGRLKVVNGHHRLDLAQRLGVPKIAVREIQAKDAAEARSVGAITNIAEGRGTPVDAAKFFRDTGTGPEALEQHGVSLTGATARDGMALSKLHQSLFDEVTAGRLPVQRGVVIGGSGLSSEEQLGLVKMLEQREGKKALTNSELGELIRFVKGAGVENVNQETLFGTESVTQSLAIEKAQLSSYIRDRLAKEKRLFGFLTKGNRATEIEGAGAGQIKVERAGQLATGAAQAEEVYTKLSSMSGPVSDALTNAAREFARGGDKNAIRTQLYNAVVDAVSATLGRGAGARGSGSLSAAVGDAAGRAPERPTENGPAGDEVEPPPFVDPDQEGFGLAEHAPPYSSDPLETPKVLAARALSESEPSTISINTPARRALRERIAEAMYGDGAPKKERQFTFLLGLPASGKSTIAELVAHQQGALLTDADAIKTQLPEFADGMGTFVVHRESVLIRDMVRDRAIAAGDNVVVQTLGAETADIRRQIRAMADAGWTVHLRFVDLAADKAARRAVNRFETGGHFVDPAYILRIGDAPARTFDALKDDPGVSTYERYDSNVPKGQAPQLAESGTNTTDGGRRGDGMGEARAGDEQGLDRSPRAGHQEEPPNAVNESSPDYDPLARYSPDWRQRSGVSAFYSRLERAIDNAPFNKGTAEQWKAALSKNVAKGEREFVGMDAFLDENAGKVLTREQVRAHFDANRIHLDETTLSDDQRRLESAGGPIEWTTGTGASTGHWYGKLTGPNAPYPSRMFTIERLAGNGKYRVGSGAGIYELRDTFEEAKNRAQEIADIVTERLVGGPKFGAHTEPGGTNYREILLRLDGDSDLLPKGYTVAPFQGGWSVFAPDGEEIGSGRTQGEALSRATTTRSRKRMPSGAFHSNHFDETNILAHVRVKDRTLPNGEKVLFVEEIQSDWHQKGREIGYSKAGRAEPNSNGWGMIEPQYPGGVPDAPFKKTDEWVGLALRRLIDEAVKGGYDRIAWTTGDQQTARYDLSKHVDEIAWEQHRDGTYLIEASKNGANVVTKTHVPAADLPGIVGKELARKLVSEAEGASHGAFHGEDLKVGGHGMKAFYDEMVPGAVRDYAKKLGLKLAVEPVNIPQPDSWIVVDNGGNVMAGFESETIAQGFVRGQAMAMNRRGLTVHHARQGMPEIPSFRITPELRAKVEGDGQMLMEHGDGYDAAGDRTDSLNEHRGKYGKDRAQIDLFQQTVDHPNGMAARRADGQERRAAFADKQELAALERRVRAAILPLASTRRRQVSNALKSNLPASVDLRGRLIVSPEDLFGALHVFRDPTAERFHVVYLDAAGYVVGHEITTSGVIDSASVMGFDETLPASAKKLGARYAYIAHNHPSGDPEPSTPDMHVTSWIGSFLQHSGVHLVGHLVINHETAAYIALKTDGDLGVTKVKLAKAPKSAYTTAVQAGRQPLVSPARVGEVLAVSTSPRATTVVYADTQRRVIAVEPIAGGLEELREIMPKRLKSLGARFAYIAGPSHVTDAIEAATNVARGREIAEWKDAWTDSIVDIFPVNANGSITGSALGSGRLRTDLKDFGAGVNPPPPPRLRESLSGESADRDARGGEYRTAETGRDVPPPRRVNEQDLFGDEDSSTESDSGNQESLFSSDEGERKTLSATERAAKNELPRLKQELELIDARVRSGRALTPSEEQRLPARRRQIASRIATLEKLVNRGGKITAAEMETRAAAGDLFGGSVAEEAPTYGGTEEVRDAARAFADAEKDIDFDGKYAKEAAKSRGGFLDRLSRFADAVSNGLGPIERLGDRVESTLRPGRNPRDLLSYTKSADYTVRTFLREGVVDPVTREIVGPSFESLFAPFKRNEKRIRQALVYIKAVRDVGRGPSSVNDDEALWARQQKIKEAGDHDPQLKAFADGWRKYVDGVGRYAVKSGLWTPELWRKLRESDALYVRFRRILDENVVDAAGGVSSKRGAGAPRRMVNVGPGVDRFEGSRRPITNPAEAMAEYTGQIIRRADRYRVGAALFDAADALGSEGQFLLTRITSKDAKVRSVSSKRARENAKDLFLDEDTLDELTDAFDLRFDKENPIIWRNKAARGFVDTLEGESGGKEYAMVNSPELWRAVAALNASDESALRAVLDVTFRPLRRVFVATTTGINPRFALGTNLVRDAMDLAAKSRGGIRPMDVLRGYGNAFRDVWGGSESNQEASRTGLGNVSMYANETKPRTFARDIAPTSKLDRVRSVVARRNPLALVLHGLERVGDASDRGPRLAEYYAAIRQNQHRVDSGEWTPEDLRLFAASRARPVTIDFANKPGNPVFRLFADYIPFFGPAVQAPISFARSAYRNPKRVAGIAAAVALLAVMAWSLKHKKSKEERMALNDRPSGERAAFIMFPLEGGGVIRIPVSAELGFVAAATMATLDAMNEKDPNAGRLLKSATIRLLPPGLAELAEGNLVPPIPGMQQAIENAENKDSFTGRPIEPTRMKDIPPAERRLDTTSPTYDALAAAARRLGLKDFSPLKAEHFVKGITSGATPLITMLTDRLASPLTGRPIPERGDLPIAQNPLNPIGAFYKPSPTRSPVSEQDYYDLRESHDQSRTFIMRASKANDAEGVRRGVREYGKNLDPRATSIFKAADKMLEELRADDARIQAGRRSGAVDADRARELRQKIATARQRVTHDAVLLLRAIGVTR